ncbi:MAG: hypothetical protein NTY74_13825 [Ignavibacteriae bacterium]|nr:hypothetical protein [Ignavibacteriota bacterium]
MEIDKLEEYKKILLRIKEGNNIAQKDSIRINKEIDLSIQITDYFLNNNSKIIRASTDFPIIVPSLDMASNWLNRAYENSIKVSSELGKLKLSASSIKDNLISDSTSAMLSTVSISGSMYDINVEHHINVFDDYEIGIPKYINDDNIRDEVNIKLEIISSDYKGIIESCWEQYYSASSEGLRNACHIFRELLEKLIRNITNVDDLKKQPWYIIVAEAHDNVSWYQKYRYLLFKDQEPLDPIAEDKIHSYSNSHKKIQKFAHSKLGEVLNANEVKENIVNLEYFIKDIKI